METQTTPLMHFRLLDPNGEIIFAELVAKTKIDLVMARELVSQRLAFTANRAHFLIADISKVRSITADAMDYMQHPDGGLTNIAGAALIASNPVSALLANIFIKTPKKFPARFFSNEIDAVNWVRRQANAGLSSTP